MMDAPGFILGHVIARFLLYFFSDHAQILTQYETVPHLKLVKEMPETSTYPLNAVNTPVVCGNNSLLSDRFLWRFMG